LNFSIPGLILFTMEEIFSGTTDPEVPLQEQQFYHLKLFDVPNALGTRRCVRQARARWSDIEGRIVWDEEQTDYFWILDEAKRKYQERRQTLAQQGFLYSDLDWF